MAKKYKVNDVDAIYIPESLDNVTLIDQGGARYVIYVRPTGSDTAGDGTLANPYLTLERAYQDIPQMFKGARYVIDITGITETLVPITPFPAVVGGRTWYNPAPAPDWGGFYYEGDVSIQAIPQLVESLNPGTTTQVVDPITYNITITDTSKSWTPGQWRGYLAVGDLGNGDVVQILDNGTDWLLVQTAFYGPPLQGTPTIYDYGATLIASDFNDALSITNAGTFLLAINGVRVTASLTAAAAVLPASVGTDLYASCSFFEYVDGANFGTYRLFSCCVKGEFSWAAVGSSNLFNGLLWNLTLQPTLGKMYLGAGGALNSVLTVSAYADQRVGGALSVGAMTMIESTVRANNGDKVYLRNTRFTNDARVCLEADGTGTIVLGTDVVGVNEGGTTTVLTAGGSIRYSEATPPSIGGSVLIGNAAATSWAAILASTNKGLVDVGSGSAISSIESPNTPLLTTQLSVFSDATRPAANTVSVGTMIYNTDDNAPNVSDGTQWRNMNGGPT